MIKRLLIAVAALGAAAGAAHYVEDYVGPSLSWRMTVSASATTHHPSTHESISDSQAKPQNPARRVYAVGEGDCANPDAELMLTLLNQWESHVPAPGDETKPGNP